MRNLSIYEYQVVSGSKTCSESSSDELVPISATVGYAIGDMMSQMIRKTGESTHFDLAHSIHACQKILSIIQSMTSIVPVIGSASKSNIASIGFHFFCGIYKGYIRRDKPSQHTES